MKNKETSIEWFVSQLPLRIQNMYASEIENAKALEKEQMIEFTDKVLDNTCGDLILLYSIEEIYNKTYKQPNNEQ